MAKRSARPTKQRPTETKRRRGGGRTGGGVSRKGVDGEATPQRQPTEMAKPTTAVAKLAPPWPTQQKVTDLAEMLDRQYPHLRR